MKILFVIIFSGPGTNRVLELSYSLAKLGISLRWSFELNHCLNSVLCFCNLHYSPPNSIDVAHILTYFQSFIFLLSLEGVSLAVNRL
ncbi:hypothetical protein SAMN03080602_01384 [Arenibacter troitsensis]|uniref:Uncharacterized protein n=1 Tax=Arenibacter troitsensis TaxID=188872 RepID=A0A1X7J147_9FLAO|nr:hypothetical protein SAMN03080602_01384 [Arenibacter troitsensis]